MEFDLKYPMIRLGQGSRTSEVFGSKFTTHPIIGYEGDGLEEYIRCIKHDYKKSGIEIKNITTYHNSGYDHATDTYDISKQEFGIEVEHS